MSAFYDGGVGLVARVGKELKSLAHYDRADLAADPGDASGIRGVVDQLMVSELHVGDGDALVLCDTAGAAVVTFNSSGAHNIGKAGQVTTFAGSVTIAQDLIVSGNTVTVNASVLEIEDNIMQVNSGPSGSRNAGLMTERYQAANDDGTGDVVQDAGALAASIADIGDQTGMAATEIKLDGAVGAADYFVGMWILVTSGLSINQVRKITDYDNVTKVATLATAWTTQNPADGDAVEIYSPFVGVIYDETDNRFVMAHLTGRLGGDTILDRIDLRVGVLTLDDGMVVSGGTVEAAGIDFGKAAGEIGDVYGDGFIRLGASGADPDAVADKGFIYQKLVGGVAELFWRDDVNAALQLTNNGALNAAGATLDTAYNGGAAITVDNGPVALSQAKTTENGGTLTIAYAASAFTGTSHGVVVDMSGATSLNNAGDIYGVSLVGQANAGAGNSVGLRISAFDVGIENTGSLNQDGAADFSGGVTNSGGELLVSGGNVQLNDGIFLTFGTGDDAALSWDNGNTKLDFDVSGELEIGVTSLDLDATGAIDIDGAGISIDGTAASNLSVTGADLTLSTLTSGSLILDGVALVDINAGANLDIDVTGTFDMLSTGAFSIDGTGDSNVSVTSGNLVLSTITAGTVDIDGVGAVSVNSSAAAINIGNDDVDQALNLGTDGERVVTVGSLNGAASLVQRAGTGGHKTISGGWSNSATDAPTAANQVVFLRSDGLSLADAASRATAAVRGAYTNTVGECARGDHLTFVKAATNAGGTTWENMTKGQEILLAASIAAEYDAGVTPAKGTVTNRASVAETAGVVIQRIGWCAVASGTDTETVVVDWDPQYIATL